MKTFIRLIALILACLCCLTIVVSCGETADTPDNGNTGKTDDPTNDDDEWTEGDDGKLRDKWGKLKDDLPDEGFNFKETITTLYWSDVEKPEFEQAEDVDDERMSSIYQRNKAVQTRLGVKLEWLSTAGNSSNMNNFLTYVKNIKQAGTQDFDMIATYSRSQGVLVTNGLLVDLNTISGSYMTYNDPENHPWWPKNLNGNMSIGDKMFFVSGDIAITVIDEMHCLYYNKDLLNVAFEEEAIANGAEDASLYLYSQVRSSQWTIDTMLHYCTNYYVDDGDGTKSINDKYGLCSTYYCACTLYGGCNLRELEQIPGDYLKISDDYTSIRTTTLVQKLGTFLPTDDYWHGDDGSYYILPFVKGNCLFMLHYLETAEDQLIGNDAIEHYGLVPLPKYDSEQVNYYTVIGNAFTIYSLFNDLDKRGNEDETLKMMTAVMECWASESYRKCTPIIFELNMQLKYSETQDETDMCEYIRAGIMFDLGRILDSAMAGGNTNLTLSFDGRVYDAAMAGSDWRSNYQTFIESAQANLEDFIANLKNGFTGEVK